MNRVAKLILVVRVIVGLYSSHCAEKSSHYAVSEQTI